MLDMVLAAGNARSLNPGALLALIEDELPEKPRRILIKRVQILDKNLHNFE